MWMTLSLLTIITQQLLVFFNNFDPLLLLKTLVNCIFFLGIEVFSHESDLILSQRKYILDILHRSGLKDCKPVSSPMTTTQVLSLDGSPLLTDLTIYRQMVGALPYATISQLDIVFFFE